MPALLPSWASAKRTSAQGAKEQDANLAALGEAWQGGGKGCRNLVMFTVGTGVGGGGLGHHRLGVLVPGGRRVVHILRGDLLHLLEGGELPGGPDDA